MKINPRAIHRDLAYFYLGLIIAFSLSGIFLNHRRDWNPAEYIFETNSVSVQAPATEDDVNDEYIASISKDWGINGKPKGFRVREGKIAIDYPNDRISIDVKTGKGERETYMKTPLVSQLKVLHIDTSVAWIWYSDIFGLAMLTIALTGMFIQKGDRGFWKRGWKLAAVGILFPLIFLFLIS